MKNEIIGGFGLSPQQSRVWRLQQSEPRQELYRVQCAVLIEGNLDIAALTEAVGQVILRHEILRTTFHYSSEAIIPLQVITDDSTPIIIQRDLSVVDPANQWGEVDGLFQEAWRAPFDLERGPLLHTGLIILSSSAHLLMIGLPALCCDLIGAWNLVGEIARSYAACLSGKILPDEPLQYADLAEWQTQLLRLDSTKTGRDYWLKQDLFRTVDLKLPLEGKDVGAARFDSRAVCLILQADVTARIEELIRKHETSASVFFLVCWQVLLYRLTRQSEITIGTSFDGRNYREIKQTIGLFAKYLPINCHLRNDSRFSQILKQIQKSIENASEWQEYFTWDHIEQEADSPLGVPFFPMSFDFNERFPHHSVEGLTFSTYRQYACLDRYKVKLSVCSGGGSIALEFHYDSTLYGIDEIERLAGQYLTLIENVVQRPRSFVSELEILSEAERRRLLVEFNNTRVDYVHGEFVHQLFEQQTVNRPESIAVVCEGSHLSYAQLNGRANQVAHHLQMLGVGPESLVAIYTERSLEMIIGIVGVLKAGGGYVPLDPASPRPRLSLMLENTQPLALLTQQKLLGDLTNGKTRIVYLDADWEAISQQSAENPISRVMAENTAYVIFTSGSSGEPKGVEIQHGGVLNLLAWHLDSYRVMETDRTSQVANPAFDASVWEIWPSLSAGASLYLADRKVYGSAADLLQWLRNEGITISFLPTALAAVLLSELRQEGLALRVLLTGGDKLSQGASTESPFRLINHYGPTEGTVVATAGLVREGNYTAPPPIGRPIANMQVYLLDAGLDAVPIGVAGDLYIAGDGLARGYLNRPEQTAERFIPNLYSDREGARLYQTGDVAQYLTGGEIEFLGRADHQVQIRGYRIELGEIEAVLRGHPAVKESVALALENEPGEKRLVAYVVTDLGYQSLDGGWGSEGVNPIPTGGDNSLESELKSYIREKLPDYMTPTAIIELNRMPMTPNGKIDRRALPTPIPMRKLGEDEATRTPVEEIIAGIWAEVLKLDRVGVNENFFDLGGHSLMATQILSRIRNALGVEVNLRVMLETPTVTALAEAVELGRGTAGRQSPIKPVDRTVTMPLSYAQQRLWFLDQLEPDSSAYNVPMAFSLRGRLKTPALTQVITEVVRRHESLRTSFPTLDKEPAQWIAEPRPVTIPIIDLSMLNREVSRQTAIRLGREEAQRLFDLSKGPVLRVSLLPQRSEEYLILMTMHHIVSDGWSVGILTGELGRLYAAYTQGEPSPLQELKIQYADYALWQRKWLPEEALERQLNYWKQTLDGMPQVLELPTDRPHSARQSYRGAIRGRDLPEPLSREIRDLSRREGATLFMTFLAAFKILLHYHTSQDDIVVGSPIANRVRTEIEPLIGFFVNTLVLRTNLSGNPGFREVLNQVREMCLGAFANQDLPFEQLVQELRPERRANQQPLFRANFVLQNAPTRPLKLKLPGLVISPFAAGFGWSPFDLIMQIVERKAGLNVSLRYNTTLFTPAKITRLCEDYETLLKSIAAHPDAKLEALYEILAAADKQQEVLEEKQLREASLQKYGRSRRKPVYSF